MASPWDAFPEVGQSPDRPTGGGVILSDPYQERGDARDETRTGIAVEGNQRDAERFSDQRANDRRDATMRLSDAYNKDPTIAEFRSALGNFATGLKTSPDAFGDNALTTLYVKTFDPGSVANVAETESAEAAQSRLENARQAVMREFDMDGSGRYSPENRRKMRQNMITRMTEAAKGYKQRRAYFADQARGFDLDPALVLGSNDIDAYAGAFEDYDRENKLGRFAEKPSSSRIPGATADNLAFDIDRGVGAFGSQIEAQRLTPEQQGALDAFLRANSGNPNFGPEQLSAFYQSLGIQGGAMAGDDAFFEAVRSGSAFGTAPNYEQSDEARRQWAEDQVRQQLGGDTIGGNVALESGLLPWTDELMGVRGGVESLLRGDGFTRGYQDTRDIERAAVRMSEEEHGMAPKLVGSLLTPAGIVSKANLARDALAIGAMYGAGEGEGFADTLGKGVTGAALGYGAGKGIEAATPIIANSQLGRRISQAASGRAAARDALAADRDAFAEAAERQGLDYQAADIPGATKTRFATSVTRSTLGGIPLAESAQKTVEKARAARDRIVAQVGGAGDNAVAGQAAQRGMEAWERKTAGRAGELYDAIPINPDTPVDLATTRQTLSDLNNSITSNPELAALVRDPRMVAYQNALESGDLTWGDIKKFRSFIGEKAGRPTLQQDTSKDSLDALYGALSQDIERAAAAHSPEAAKAFSRANNYYRGRQARLGEVMSKIVGKDGNMSAEDTFKQIERWAQAKGGDFNKLARAVRSLPDDEANTIRATIIDRLGDSNPGAQNAANDNFSPDVFLTQWAKLSDRAKGVLFQGEHRKALDDLATVFEGTKFSRGFDNKSGTAIGFNATALGAAGLASWPLAVALSGLQFAGGKLLASPKFARWMVALSKKPNPSAQLAHVNQLTAIARAEPVIANDIFSLQERLAQSFTQPSSLRSAAEEDNELGKPPPAQGKRDDAQ